MFVCKKTLFKFQSFEYALKNSLTLMNLVTGTLVLKLITFLAWICILFNSFLFRFSLINFVSKDKYDKKELI